MTVSDFPVTSKGGLLRSTPGICMHEMRKAGDSIVTSVPFNYPQASFRIEGGLVSFLRYMKVVSGDFVGGVKMLLEFVVEIVRQVAQ